MFNQYTFRTMSSINRRMERMGETVAAISNVFTTGYKQNETSFHETLNGMKAYQRRDFTDGVSRKTNRELDFAIEGKGFFEVLMPDGTLAYTRDGSFTVGPNGQLLSAQGYPISTVNPDGEFIAQTYDAATGQMQESFDVGINSAETFVPIGSSVHLDSDGTLATDDGQKIGKLSVVTFTNNDGLVDIGDGLFIASEKTGEAIEVGVGDLNNQTHVKQGYLEVSNSSIVGNMADMVQLNTAIKAEMKVIKVLDQMQENLTSTITRNI